MMFSFKIRQMNNPKSYSTIDKTANQVKNKPNNNKKLSCKQGSLRTALYRTGK